MDNNLNTPNDNPSKCDKSPDSLRFRVDRIDSVVLGLQQQQRQQSINNNNNNNNNNTKQNNNTINNNNKNSFTGSEGEGEELRDLSNFINELKESARKPSGFNKMANNITPGRKFSTQSRKISIQLPDIDEFHQMNATYGGYGKTLHTQEFLPNINNYRNMESIQAAQRPTLDELHDEKLRASPGGISKDVEDPTSGTAKFGWIEGCLVRCLLNIWGVMLFLRISWMVAHSGLLHSMIIIAISTVVTTITTLSMSAVSTNGEVKGGGIYFMISRSLGPAFGGSIGVVFSFANAGMAALNTVGFSESMISLLGEHGLMIIDGKQNDNRIISVIALIVMQSIIIIGMEWEAKAQMGLLVILLVAMVDFVIGTFMGPQSTIQEAKGFLGVNNTVFMTNFYPGYRFSEGTQQDFFTIFSIFFPAVAGIQAGASISGDLKDPGEAIPKGTLLAIFITSASYAAFALLAGAGTIREASGIESEVADWSFTNCTGRECKWGLYNDYNVMSLMAIFSPLIYAGCFAATISSALSCLVSGAKTFQGLCLDNVYPILKRVGKGYGKSQQEPYVCYALGFVIALIFILIADLNAIAPLISNFFMVAYALLNFCVFHANWLKPIGWRPTFKYYNTWLSLFGSLACVAIMFMMSWQTALVSFICAVALYIVVVYQKPDLNWGDTTQAQSYSNALKSLQSMAEKSEHVKNYHPQILCLSGYPTSRPDLVDFANMITKNSSLLLCGNILTNKERLSGKVRRAILDNGYSSLHDRNVKGFYSLVENCESLTQGSHSLIQSSGIGKLAPNILLVGWKGNWQKCHIKETIDYFNTLHNAMDYSMSVAILRVKGGLDTSQADSIENLIFKDEGIHRIDSSLSLGYGDSDADGEDKVSKDNRVDNKAGGGGGGTGGTGGGKDNPCFDPDDLEVKKRSNKLVLNGGKKSKNKKGKSPKEDMNQLCLENSIFTSKQPKGTIDVWWLYDDGGLTLLLPWILCNFRKNWSQCTLRVFSLSTKRSEMELEQRGMVSLLSKFRIEYSDLTIISDITARAQDNTKAFFESIIKNFKGDPEESDNPEGVISDYELLAMKEKTNRHLRLRELLIQHSSSSNLIVMTLPVPRKGTVSTPLYMSWLEVLSRDLNPNMLFVRGNQQSVLTFYS